jgi:hypothetical protein
VFGGQERVMQEKAGQATDLHCSFCKKDREQVRKLIGGPGVHICDECVAVCVDIIEDADRPAVSDLESHRDPSRSPRWSGGGNAVTCAFCRMPFLMEEALLIEGKGVLCRPCVSQIQALSTEGAFSEGGTGS